MSAEILSIGIAFMIMYCEWEENALREWRVEYDKAWFQSTRVQKNK